MELIHKKYSIKNTTGYSINALADFPPSDPIEIVKRLMIGSDPNPNLDPNPNPDPDPKRGVFEGWLQS